MREIARRIGGNVSSAFTTGVPARQQVERTWTVELQDPTQLARNGRRVPLPFGNGRGCRFFDETAFTIGADLSPRVTAERGPNHSRRSDCPKHAEGGTDPRMASVLRRIGAVGKHLDGIAIDPSLVVKQVVLWTPWTESQADQQGMPWMLIARDIDRGPARPFDPAAVSARLTPLLQPRRSERPIPMTSNRCVARGSMVMRRRRLPDNGDGHEGRGWRSWSRSSRDADHEKFLM